MTTHGRAPPPPNTGSSESGDPREPSLNRPTLDEMDAFYRNPSSLRSDRLELAEAVFKEEYVDGGARAAHLRRRKQIEEALEAEANK